MNLRMIITIITMFALAGPVLAEGTGGRLVAVRGKVWTQAPGDVELRARVGKTLANGTRIRTGNNGKAEVVFEDGSSIIIHNNTTMLISGIKRHLEKKLSILIFIGRVWNKVSTTIGKQVSYEVNTPVVVCGVRGTEFETAVGVDGTVLVSVAQGEVAVAGNGRSAAVRQNQMVEAEPEKGLGKTSESEKEIDWDKWQKERRENLRKNGKNLVDNFKKRITKQKGKLKELRDRQKEVEKKHNKALKRARAGDEDAIDEVRKYNAALIALVNKIADLGDVAVCQFGLVDHFAKLAIDPRFQMIDGKYVKKKAKRIRRNKAVFDKMIKKGTIISKKARKKITDPSPTKLKPAKVSPSATKTLSKKQLKRAGAMLTPLPPGSRTYKTGAMIPIKVVIKAKAESDLIFEFQKMDGKLWRKMKKQKLTSPKIVKRKGQITQTRYIRFAKPGKYHWRCSANNGKSWSAWSKPIKVVQTGIPKKTKRVINKKPLKKIETTPKPTEIKNKVVQ